MKKYGSLLIVVTIIVVTFSMYYIRMASAEKKMSEITFEKISGDARYFDNLIMEGTVENEFDFRYLTITNGQVNLQKYKHLYYRPLFWFDQLIDKHKSFMRGKVPNANSYFENEEQLIYVEFLNDTEDVQVDDSLKFSIEVLNKGTDHVESMIVETKLAAPFEYFMLEHMELVGNELKLVIVLYENGNETAHLMTVDLKTKQLINDLVFESPDNQELQTDIAFYNSYFNIESEKYLVYSLAESDAKMESDKFHSQQFKTLNLETNAINDFDVPAELLDNEDAMQVSEQLFHSATILDGTVILNRYNISQQNWLEPITLDLPYKVPERATISVSFAKDKSYISVETPEGTVLFIVDSNSGEILYSGLMKLPELQEYIIRFNYFYEI